MSYEPLHAQLKALGLKKTYFPRPQGEKDTLILETRKPAKIVGGYLEGCDIDLWDPKQGIFRVWTNRKKKSLALARQYDLKVRPMDGEAELYVPAALADALLPAFGAKIKHKRKPLTEDQLKALKERFERVRNARFKGSRLDSQGTSGAVPPPEGHRGTHGVS